MRTPHPNWPDEQVALLKKLWGEGLSASKIGTRLGNKTRNAVIGKVHRMGLEGRPTTERNPWSFKDTKSLVPHKGPRKRVLAPKPVHKSAWQRHLDSQPVSVEPTVETPIPLHQRRTIETLEAHDCRWPIGDPQEADFHFCGAKRVGGIPYCEHHAHRAFTPVKGPSHSAAPRYSTIAGGVVGVQVRKLEDA